MLQNSDYEMIKSHTFKIINKDTSLSIIEDELHFLSKTFDVPYNQVVDEFNQYNIWVWCIKHE